jgi:hypothetical protein
MLLFSLTRRSEDKEKVELCWSWMPFLMEEGRCQESRIRISLVNGWNWRTSF